MSRRSLTIHRLSEQFISDDRRVITRLFNPGGPERVRRVVDRVCGLSDQAVARALSAIERDFSERHKNLDAALEENFRELAPHVGGGDALDERRRRLLGAYFTMEYAIEAAALFNPSIVPHPDQQNVPAGALRFIMSLRATGEGHVSSITFRTGTISADHRIRVHYPSRYVEAAKRVKDRVYDKHTIFLKLIEMGVYNDVTEAVLDRLGDQFVYEDLLRVSREVEHFDFAQAQHHATLERIRWLARSNYHLNFPPDCDTSEVVIFPVSENESRGIEDARWVRFVDDDGSFMYYATYTAYNGFDILPQLIATKDFRHFRITTLNGQFVQNKGAALFPRRINGWFAMISRIDGENLYYMWSDNIRFWNDAEPLQQPKFPWEFVQIGNCGSPLETDEGWLLLTHGVGPMRRYCIGATLLDLEDPRKIIAQTREPLLEPNDREREGYVPNVVYTCGAVIHNGMLIMPYAMSDAATSVATIPLSDLLDHLLER